jgi:hypothetical protein
MVNDGLTRVTITRDDYGPGPREDGHGGPDENERARQLVTPADNDVIARLYGPPDWSGYSDDLEPDGPAIYGPHDPLPDFGPNT